ncbi:pfh1 [Symbiodinium necroappetens]|uniref:Pfh1 protein n=1 Tax=Symbiodinium necroappetens TaxID=1628268 RepID=A0A813BLK5_9DINO|nr:pfh1 [Symbiodinium necroappetens]
MEPKSSLKLGELTTNQRGGKVFPASAQAWQFQEWTRILWHPSPYGSEEARRISLCLEPNEAAVADLKALEEDVKRQLTRRSLDDAKIFGRHLAASDVEARFVSCLKTSARGNSFIKLKVDLSRVNFWDAEQQPLEEPGNLAGRECKLRAELKQVWLMSGQCGLLVEVTDLMLKEELPRQCPF